jgi:NDP-sugar pyrophosphorylase family protein
MAAGLGKRLRPLTLRVPKPLAPVLNRPIMEHIVFLVRDAGMTEIVSNLSHLGEQVSEHFGDGSAFGVELTYNHEPELLGTAGGVREVADFLTAGGDFFVMAGDALTDIDLAAMRRFHDSHDGLATLAVKKVKKVSEYGVVIHDGDGRIQGFQEKPAEGEALSDVASCMIYMFRPEVFEYFPDKPVVDFAMEVFPAMLDAGVAFYIHEIDAYWNDVGNLHELLRGNFDALAGRVKLASNAAEVGDGIRGPAGWSVPEGVEITGPALIGEDVEIGAGAWLHGPLLVGDGVRIGEGAQLREAVVLAGTEIAARAMVGHGVVG